MSVKSVIHASRDLSHADALTQNIQYNRTATDTAKQQHTHTYTHTTHTHTTTVWVDANWRVQRMRTFESCATPPTIARVLLIHADMARSVYLNTTQQPSTSACCLLPFQSGGWPFRGSFVTSIFPRILIHQVVQFIRRVDPGIRTCQVPAGRQPRNPPGKHVQEVEEPGAGECSLHPCRGLVVVVSSAAGSGAHCN